MNFSELKDLIKEHNNGDSQEALLDLIRLYEIQQENPYVLDEIINELAKDNGLCPQCGSELEKKKFKDKREFFGSLCNEDIVDDPYCNKCKEYISYN